ncbi:MAG: Gfo/Idh/MocA family oxidoreductase [Ferruginibacter sp.]
MNTDEIIKVGLIGFGAGGQTFHAPILTSVEGLQLVKIRASRQEQVAVAASRYPMAEIVSTAGEIIEDERIDLVVITTPNDSHHSLALQALRAGKHVVVDKPFTINTKEADELIATAEASNLVLSVYQSRRFDSDFRTVQGVINHGFLGGLVELESRYDRFRNYLKPGAWREEDAPGTGILYDLGAHLIDQALILFGLPKAITADLRIQRKSGKAIDNFELILHYDNLKATLKAGMLVKEALPRFYLFGTNGSFVKYGLDPQEEALKAGYTPLTKVDWGIESSSIEGRINTDWNGMQLTGNIKSEKGNYADFYSNVCQTIPGKESLLVTPQQARNNIRIIELAMQSQTERRTIDYSFS